MWSIAHSQPSDYLTQPWKNDLGVTHEICKDSETPYRWRLSWAKLPASGPFSPFPGYQRTIVILKGGPVTLSHEGKKDRPLMPLESYSFSGALVTQATVSAPSEDFNVFSLAGKARANVYARHLTSGEDLQFPIAGQEHFVFCVRGTIAVADPNSEKKFVMKEGDTVRFSRATREEFLNLRARGESETATCLWVVIHLTL